jgi:hypothetical protein
MDPNSTNYSGSNAGAGNSALGGGTDSLGVTGTGAGQSSAGGLTPSSAGSQSMGGSFGSSSSGQGGQGLSEQPLSGGQHLGDRLGDAKEQAADKLGQARDAASEKLGQAREVAGEKLGQAKEKATELKATLADKLDQGAQALRNQQGGQQFAGANGATVGGDSSLGKYAAPAAGAMEATAQFLRGEGDIKGAIEEQVRTAPGRTLLIAVGLGYVLGKAIRR